MDVRYDDGEWQASFEQADIAEWKSEDPALADWPLSRWMCDLCNGRQEIADDPALIEAIINVLADVEQVKSFSKERFLIVLKSFDSTTGDDFEELAEDYARENGDDALASLVRHCVSAEDAEKWYAAYVQGENKVCADTNAGGTLYWFRRDEW